MRRPRDPADIVIRVECGTLLSLHRAEELHAVVVYEDGGGAALAGVGLHCLLEGEDRGCAVRGDG